MKKKLDRPRVFILVGIFVLCSLFIFVFLSDKNPVRHNKSQQNDTVVDRGEEFSTDVTRTREIVDTEIYVEQVSEENEDISLQQTSKTEVSVSCPSEEDLLIETIEQENLTSEFGNVDTQCDTSQQLVTTEHVHNFVITSSCAYWPEEGHYESICVEEGYTEELYENYSKYCYYCGTVMDDWGLDELLNHSSVHGAYGSYQIVVDTIIHEPIYEEIWVVDKEEFYEEEVIVECIDCGYKK